MRKPIQSTWTGEKKTNMASRITAIRQILPEIESALQSFTSSPSKFRVVRTVNGTSTQPRTLYILDSSFNPPSAAHFTLATSALHQQADSETGPVRLLLLFSTHNADKAPSPATFVQRMALMTAFAHDLSQHADDISIDIGLTKEPYYSDKSAAIMETTPCFYSSNPIHVHLVGYDTLVRFCNPKYYPKHDPPLSALRPFFEAGHKLRVTQRPTNPNDMSSSNFGTTEDQEAYIQSLRDGGQETAGFESSWARNIDLVQAKDGVGVSSTRVRAAAQKGKWSEVGELCTKSVAAWLRDQSLYSDDANCIRWEVARLEGYMLLPHIQWAFLSCHHQLIHPLLSFLLLGPSAIVPMASKLCCTAEQEGRSESPELPNARVSESRPVHQPLLAKQNASSSPRRTSAQSEDLHELRQIFENAQDAASNQSTPTKAKRARTSRPSIYSLRSLHRMTSMRSIIRKKFSKDLKRKDSKASALRPKTDKALGQELDTVIKNPNGKPNRQVKVTKEDIQKDLLSDKRPIEGGYDSDAKILDDIARNVAKSSPSKRPSIHSVDWSPSTGSKSTPGSSTQRRNSVELKSYERPYQIQQPKMKSFSSRFTQVFSTPNLRPDCQNEKGRTLRRSHSATSTRLPKPSPISPLRLPSLTSYDKDGVPWSEFMSESLRLSQFPVPPRHASLNSSKTTVLISPTDQESPQKENTECSHASGPDHGRHTTNEYTTIGTIDFLVQQPTAIACPPVPTPVCHSYCESAARSENCVILDAKDKNDEDKSRRSVHLHSMRIGHHLRSGSLLSWEQLADVPDVSVLPHPSGNHVVPDMSQFSFTQRPLTRHERQTSSSGFASSKIPSKWGTVLPNDRNLRADVASSIYSCRPQSPPDSLGGSLDDLSRSATVRHALNHSSINLEKMRRSSSFLTDTDDTPRPGRYWTKRSVVAQDSSSDISPGGAPTPLPRKNSVAATKKSKFREEFGPSPPRKKVTPTASIMKFLNPKRSSMRSQSEANLQADVPRMAMDGLMDTLPVPVPANRERRVSLSMQSFQIEQDALGKNKGANHVWDEALKAHQEEKASMFLPQNKDLAIHASPFRERSGSLDTRRHSIIEHTDTISPDSSPSKRVSVPITASHIMGHDHALTPMSRRNASAGLSDSSLRQDIAGAFDMQGDGAAVVGAWGRFPSHNRNERTASAGMTDRVKTRDFALEAAMLFAMSEDNMYDDNLIDPMERGPLSSPLPGVKKQKKKFGSGKIVRSNSMTFGRKLIKNYYSGIFKSSSYEFQRHGRGHRSSIVSGGTLEHPELELLPEVFMSNTTTDGAGEGKHQHSHKQVVRRHSEQSGDNKIKDKLPTGDSMATLRPRRNSSTPNFSDFRKLHDGTDNSEHSQDRARVWSVYYETCVPSFPRLSTDVSASVEGFGSSSRMPFDNRPTWTQPRILPARSVQHSRNASQLSRRSTMSQGRVKLVSLGEDDNAVEKRSIVSIRRSTMDLISKVKEQEKTEHARIISLTRAESRRKVELMATL
ncbi:hypothetical protein GQ44DRAFT_753835 [Phaeosphaeriaceae sp. PMI808]|nr:hypothetical protein GQ44DRAFT_753835 [Phaeosphaeriaceae sp. PMI808]